MFSIFRIRTPVALWALCALSTLACNRGPAARPIAITLNTADASATFLDVTGLSGAELRDLSARALDEAAWQRLFPVTVSGNNIIPVSGRYAVTSRAVEFHPRFPFDTAQSYNARFDPALLPTPRREPATVTAIVFDRPARSPSTSVTAIDPSAGIWPENMLRFYVHFSAPMSRGHRTDFVHLIDDRGNEVPDAILAAFSDLWNPETTRLTVFFDPGRVKRGVGANVRMGRAIVAGRRYTIAVDAMWPDATGQPLTAPFRREFTAGPPAYGALAVADWRVTPPRSGGRDALTIAFPAPLDRALLERTVGVRSGDADIAGHATVASGETHWSFVPDMNWPAGRYQIVVLGSLEDPAGNRIGRAFEVLSRDDDPAAPHEASLIRIPFEIK